MAEAIEKSCGKGRGYYQEMVDGILRPRVDPRRLLMRAVQCHTENILAGSGGRFTYRRPARRPAFGGLLRPRSFRPVPRILVIIDTSGSMSSDELKLAVGLVAKVLSGLNLRDGLRVICADDGVQFNERVFDPSKIELRGRGGTCFRTMLGAAEEMPVREKPELCVLVTDGEDSWPSPPSFPVVACLTRDPRYFEVPAWVDRVNLYC